MFQRRYSGYLAQLVLWDSRTKFVTYVKFNDNAKRLKAVICKQIKQTKNQTQRGSTQLSYPAVYVGADSRETGNTQTASQKATQTLARRHQYFCWSPYRLRSGTKCNRASTKLNKLQKRTMLEEQIN